MGKLYINIRCCGSMYFIYLTLEIENCFISNPGGTNCYCVTFYWWWEINGTTISRKGLIFLLNNFLNKHCKKMNKNFMLIIFFLNINIFYLRNFLLFVTICWSYKLKYLRFLTIQILLIYPNLTHLSKPIWREWIWTN